MLASNKDVLNLKINLCLLTDKNLCSCLFIEVFIVSTPSPPKKAFRTNFLPPPHHQFILLFLTVHHKGVVPLLLNFISFVLHFLLKDPQGQKNANCIELACSWLEMVLHSFFSFSVHIFQITHRFMNMILTFKFCQIKGSFK